MVITNRCVWRALGASIVHAELTEKNGRGKDVPLLIATVRGQDARTIVDNARAIAQCPALLRALESLDGAMLNFALAVAHGAQSQAFTQAMQSLSGAQDDARKIVAEVKGLNQ